jgi:hypothetical protein
LEALQNPRHLQHKELLEWLGEDYDPENFSIEAINRILHGRKKSAVDLRDEERVGVVASGRKG